MTRFPTSHGIACGGACGGASGAVVPDRRTFVTQALLAAVGVVVTGACGDGEIGGPLGPRVAPSLDPPLVVNVGDFAMLATVGGIARVDPGTTLPVAVSRTGESTFRAFSMICPHAGYAPISIQDGAFRCPNHGARFAADGQWTGGQRTSNLREYPVAFDTAANTLTIG